MNRVKDRYRNGRYAFGTWINISSPATVEIAALAGLDYVRLDPYHLRIDDETLRAMITAARDHRIASWVRVRNDRWAIANVLNLGADGITIPNVGDADAARAAVVAAYFPPKGTRNPHVPLHNANLAVSEYIERANDDILVSCQIEGREGIENYREIVQVDGVDVIQAGRGDLALAFGMPGELFHPKILEMEERIVTAALDAGKQVSLLYPATSEGLEHARRWMERGVMIMTIDIDYQVLIRSYQEAIRSLQSPQNS